MPPRITSQTIARLKKNPLVGLAEALHRSMLAMIEGTSSSTNAYPAILEPFVLVGEARQQLVEFLDSKGLSCAPA